MLLRIYENLWKNIYIYLIFTVKNILRIIHVYALHMSKYDIVGNSNIYTLLKKEGISLWFNHTHTKKKKQDLILD